MDFFDYLETLDWEDVCRVHDVRLWCPIESLDFVDGGWKWNDRQGMYRRMVEEGGLRLVLKAYAKAKTLDVSVKCANDPVAHGFGGLTRLLDLLSAVRGRYLNCDAVPLVGDWKVTQWHFGRDTKGSIAGADFALSFKDWFGNLCRIYSRHDAKVRAERVENPNVKVGRLLNDEAGLVDIQESLVEIKAKMSGYGDVHFCNPSERTLRPCVSKIRIFARLINWLRNRKTSQPCVSPSFPRLPNNCSDGFYAAAMRGFLFQQSRKALRMLEDEGLVEE